MIDPWQPKPGTIGYRLVKFFCDHINFCEGFYYGTDTEKPENKLYSWFYKYWLWPFNQNDCMCCNTVRGLIYGAVIGFLFGRIL